MTISKTLNFENTPQLGKGIYTARDIADILHLKEDRVRRWMHVYWDGKLGEIYGQKYSWNISGNRAVSFHTLVEFYVMLILAEANAKPKDVVQAHIELSGLYKTPFPFANKSILDKLRHDGGKLYLVENEDIMCLNGTKQLALRLIHLFLQKLDFDDDLLANRFWPRGRNVKVVVDPQRKFGRPVLEHRNIYPETLFDLYQNGDNIAYIAHIYGIDEEEVKEAIKYCKAA